MTTKIPNFFLLNSFLFLSIFLIITFVFVLFHQKLQPQPNLSEMTALPEDVRDSISSVKTNSNVLAAKSIRIPILMFHYVEYVKDPKDTIRKSLNITPYTFDKQLQTLTQAGYTFLNTQELIDISFGRKQLPQKPIVLTFDDGYRDFYTDAYPILKKYHVKAIAYIVPGFLNKPNNLDRWQLDEIAKDGLVEIGAHTINHTYLKGISKSRAISEIVNSKTELENEIGKTVLSFAYPYGAFDLQAVQIVRDAGFIDAVSTIPGHGIVPENQFFLNRLRAGARTGNDLINFLEQNQIKK